jgi:hypothetical protein
MFQDTQDHPNSLIRVLDGSWQALVHHQLDLYRKVQQGEGLRFHDAELEPVSKNLEPWVQVPGSLRPCASVG